MKIDGLDQHIILPDKWMHTNPFWRKAAAIAVERAATGNYMSPAHSNRAVDG